MAIYWLEGGEEPIRFGICFEGEGFGIARQSLVESMAFGCDALDAAVNQLAASDSRPNANSVE